MKIIVITQAEKDKILAESKALSTLYWWADSSELSKIHLRPENIEVLMEKENGETKEKNSGR